MRTRVLAFAIAAAPLLLAAPAAATAPTVETVTVHRHFEFPGACGSFGVIADFSAERRITTFYDQEGNTVRTVIRATTPGTVTNSVTGTTLPAFGERFLIFDANGVLVSSTGTNVHVVVPGMGTVQIAAGHTGVDEDGLPFAHGRLDPPITQALCDALAA